MSALFDAFWNVPSSDDATFSASLKTLTERLTITHALLGPVFGYEGTFRVRRRSKQPGVVAATPGIAP